MKKTTKKNQKLQNPGAKTHDLWIKLDLVPVFVIIFVYLTTIINYTIA